MATAARGAERLIASRLHLTVFALLAAAHIAVPARAQTAPALSHAIELFEARRYASAESALVELSRRESTDARAPVYLGRIALARGRTRDAVVWLETAIRRDERSATSRTWLARALMVEAQSASMLRRPGLARRARSELERAVALDPRSVPARRTLMEVYLRAPRAFGGSRSRAEEQQAALATLDPAAGHLTRAILVRHDGDAAGAERELRAALRERAAPVEAYDVLGQVLADQKRYDEAAVVFADLAREWPAERWALYESARLALVGGKQLGTAEKNVLAYLREPPAEGDSSHASAQVLLGRIYERQSRGAEAQSAYLEATRLDPAHRDARAALDRVRR